MGNEIQNILGQFSIEEMEKLKVLFSIMPQTEQKEIVTLRVFADEYKNIIRNNRSSAYLRSVTISLEYLVEYFGAQKSISSIQFKDIENFVIHLQRTVKKGYVVYFRNLKAAFNKAKDWKYIAENHFLKIKLPKKQRVNPAYVNGDQLLLILRHIVVTIVRDIIIIAFYTGMRLNEIVKLRWKNINLVTRIITVGDEDFVTKGRNQRFIPISDEAFTALLALREKKVIPIGNSYVFSKPNGEPFTGDYFSKRFKRACKSAGIDKAIHFHSLRHSFASNLAQKGVNLYTIKELLGHSSITTTEIYSHLNMDSLREAIKTIDQNQINKTPELKLIIK